MFYLLSIFWFIRQTKATLFWLYLWQLKEYHIGRFLDHFRTDKGKRIFLNKLFILKVFLIFTFLTTIPGVVVIFALLFVYLFESVKSFKDFFQQKLKKPVLTKKTVFLISIALIFQILFVLLNFTDDLRFVIYLLLFDILTPAIISGIVLFCQPLVVLLRNQIIKKAKLKRGEFKDLLVIGITGSYGKTSTKEFLATILSEKFKVLKTKEHQNSEVGISQCILDDLKPEHEIFVVEMGAYNKGGIKLLCDITKPKIGILTGINEQHMATFGSQENIIKTKFELIESLPEDGIAFFNAKNKYCLELYQKTKVKKKLYGQEVKLAGLENIEGAKAVARELGLSEEEISSNCQKIRNKFGGIQLKKGVNGLNIIEATYSANPDGVIAHLEYMRNWLGKRLIVMPCLIELGSASKEIHKKIGEKIGEVCDLAIITTKERFKEIKEGATEKARLRQGSGGQRIKEGYILFLENPKEIFEKIKSFCSPGDAILLESRVPEELIKQLT